MVESYIRTLRNHRRNTNKILVARSISYKVEIKPQDNINRTLEKDKWKMWKFLRLISPKNHIQIASEV